MRGRNATLQHLLKEEVLLPNHRAADLKKKPDVVISEEYTQIVDNFTDDGDFILSDEADIPESAQSARAMPSIVQTPVFKKKSKNMIDEGLLRSLLSDKAADTYTQSDLTKRLNSQAKLNSNKMPVSHSVSRRANSFVA
jgi:hypothetical protein